MTSTSRANWKITVEKEKVVLYKLFVASPSSEERSLCDCHFGSEADFHLPERAAGPRESELDEQIVDLEEEVLTDELEGQVDSSKAVLTCRHLLKLLQCLMENLTLHEIVVHVGSTTSGEWVQ